MTASNTQNLRSLVLAFAAAVTTAVISTVALQDAPARTDKPEKKDVTYAILPAAIEVKRLRAPATSTAKKSGQKKALRKAFGQTVPRTIGKMQNKALGFRVASSLRRP